MALSFRNMMRAGFCLVALLTCGAARADGAWIGYKNDTQVVVVVQGSSPVPNGQVRRGQPHQINSKEAAWDQVQAGNKTITVTDPRTNKVLWQGPVTVGDKDLFFSIQADVGPDKQPRFKLVPAAVPAGMMPRKK